MSPIQIRSLEQKHSDSVRELAKQLEQDREHWSAQNDALEKRIKGLEAEGDRLRGENGRLEERNCALEAEQVQHQKQLADLLETNIRLNTDICDLEELQNSAAFNRTDRENEEIMELMEKITRLQMENTDLRDRNDELCAELDVLVGELSVIKGRGGVVMSSSRSNITGNNNNNNNVSGHLDASIDSSLDDNFCPGTSPSVTSGATKRRGDSPSKSKIAEESPRLGKLRKRSTGVSEDESLLEEMPLNAELESQVMAERRTEEEEDNSTLVSDLKARVTELESLLKDLKTTESENSNKSKESSSSSSGEIAVTSDEKQNNNKCLNCEEMESSLDLMRKEFDSLEDYWQGKLNEERVLFEEEQRVNDDKFNDLLQKMMEYEEQFSSTMKKDGQPEERDPRLSPIEERGFLEQQYMDLEEELNGLKRILREKNEEIKALRADVNKNRQLPSIVAAQDPFNISIDQTSPPVSPAASSPINYLWSQSTIQAPARDYQNPNWQQKKEPQQQQLPPTPPSGKDLEMTLDVEEAPIVVSPIQKPKPGSLLRNGDGLENCDKVSVASSNDRHSTATYNVVTKGQRSNGDVKLEEPDVSGVEEDVNDGGVVVKDLIDAVDAEELRQLQEDCKELVHRRDALLHELQQLNEMRPTLERNFAVSRRG